MSVQHINKALHKAGMGTTPELTQSSNDWLSQWANYDPNANTATGTNVLTGSGPGAIIDQLARNAYSNVSTAVNDQAQTGRDLGMEALSKRGILNSSEAGNTMSILEAERLRNIRDAGTNIEQQRLSSLMSLPGQAMQIGNYAQNIKQQNLQDILAKYGLVNQTRQVQAQRDENANGQDATTMQAISGLAQGAGALVGMFAGGPAGAALGSAAGSSLTNMFLPSTSQYNQGSALAGIPSYNIESGYYDQTANNNYGF